jgi:hypothetical protein
MDGRSPDSPEKVLMVNSTSYLKSGTYKNNQGPSNYFKNRSKRY